MVAKKFGLSLGLTIVTALLAAGCSSAPEPDPEPDPNVSTTVESPELKTQSTCSYCYVSTYGRLVCITYPC
jgi:hypothetical protein